MSLRKTLQIDATHTVWLPLYCAKLCLVEFLHCINCPMRYLKKTLRVAAKISTVFQPKCTKNKMWSYRLLWSLFSSRRSGPHQKAQLQQGKTFQRNFQIFVFFKLPFHGFKSGNWYFLVFAVQVLWFPCNSCPFIFDWNISVWLLHLDFFHFWNWGAKAYIQCLGLYCLLSNFWGQKLSSRKSAQDTNHPFELQLFINARKRWVVFQVHPRWGLCACWWEPVLEFNKGIYKWVEISTKFPYCWIEMAWCFTVYETS